MLLVPAAPPPTVLLLLEKSNVGLVVEAVVRPRLRAANMCVEPGHIARRPAMATSGEHTAVTVTMAGGR